MAAKTINDLTALAFAGIDSAADLAALWDATASETKKVILYELIMAGLLIPAAGSGAGTSFTWKGQNAGSGNSAGGSLLLEPGLKAGSGADGRIKVSQPGGTSNDQIHVYHDGTSGYIGVTAQDDLIQLGPSDLERIYINSAWLSNGAFTWQLTNDEGVRLANNRGVYWSTNSTSFGSPDTGIVKVVAGVCKTDDGSGGSAWLQNSSGLARLTTSPTNVGTTLDNLTDLTLTVKAGRKYTGRIVLFINNALAADGFKFDLNGGTATMTSIEFGIASAIGSTIGTRTSTALGTALTITALPDTNDLVVEIPVGFVVNAAGTIIPRQAKNADAAGATLTTRLNSYFMLDDSPN